MCYLITDENSAAKRHAYLIMAHSNPSQLCTLLKQIDDSRNDIFLHWDQKFPMPPQEEFFSVVKHSKLTFVPKPIAVYWGDYSLIQCELLLLQSATDKHEYDYYHLLSGQDLLAVCLFSVSSRYGIVGPIWHRSTTGELSVLCVRWSSCCCISLKPP